MMISCSHTSHVSHEIFCINFITILLCKATAATSDKHIQKCGTIYEFEKKKIFYFSSFQPDWQQFWGAELGRLQHWPCWRRRTKVMKTAGRSLAGYPGWVRHYCLVHAAASTGLCLHLCRHPSGRAKQQGILQCGSASAPCELPATSQSNYFCWFIT